MAQQDTKFASRALEALLVFSSGLCRTWPRSDILAAYPSVYEFKKTYRTMDRLLLRSDEPLQISNIDRLTAMLQRYSTRELIIATAHHGHFIAFLCACARFGIPLSLCYQAASPSYLDAAARHGLALIDLKSCSTVLSLFHRIDRERSNGRYVAIMIDGPFESRTRYKFLGYQIEGSSLASLYARKTSSALLPIVPNLSAALQLGFTAGPVVAGGGQDTTQHLLDFLQSVILREHPQYQWLSTSVLMSDEEARNNALGFIRHALTWRELH
jgi:lauroyl/myristoyl acyltransferase